jgi:SH3-like domain-containing protein
MFSPAFTQNKTDSRKKMDMDSGIIEAALKEIGRPFADRRLNVFEMEAAELEGNTLRLRGRVLEEDNRQALVRGLAGRLPGVRVDAQAVEVVRKSAPKLLTVATNLTSMHNGTSFLAEMATQMLNGVALEVLWEEKNWCFVRQMDGYLGWTYRPYLTDLPAPAPTHLVTAPVGLLREGPRPDAGLVTRVLGGTTVCASQAEQGWAHLDLAGGMQGWLPVEDLRGLADLPQTAQARQAQLVADAFSMIGVPYLWGGCSANGIDCSGFAQLLHRWVGLTLPRDADMQFAAGKEVEPPFEAGDLLFFGEKGEARSITHVGVSLGGWKIMHSSRRRNGVQVDNVQAVDGLRESYLCAATFARR